MKLFDKILPSPTVKRANAVAKALEEAADARARGEDLTPSEIERVARQHGYTPPEERGRHPAGRRGTPGGGSKGGHPIPSPA